VQEAARGREPEGAGVDGLAGERRHAGDVVAGGGRLLEAAGAHHVVAQGAVADHAADVEAERAPAERGEVVAVGLPAPVEPGHDRVGRDVLDGLHHLGEVGLLAGADRGERHAAVAEHDRRDAVPARRAGDRVPEQLGVEVGVDVDEPGRHEPVGGVDLAAAPLGHVADGGDAPAVDRHLRAAGRGAGPVGDLATPDHDVVHAAVLPSRGSGSPAMISEPSFSLASLRSRPAAVKTPRQDPKRGSR
jgi:hypothetical protein